VTDYPLVSVITPTFPGREKVLLERCMPSVQTQDWPGCVEHVIVSDENAPLERKMHLLAGLQASIRTEPRFHTKRSIRFVEINDTWKNEATRAANGAVPWMIGSRLALGEFVSFLGDDDELLPHHVSAHVAAMREAEAMWSLSKVEFRAGGEFYNVIGDESFIEGHLDATGIMCWKGALATATWDPAAGIAAVDWKLVQDWRNAGLRGAFIDDVTGIHHDGWLSGFTGKPYHEPYHEPYPYEPEKEIG
jgi:hypothetical protein